MRITSRTLDQQDIANIMIKVSQTYDHNLRWDIRTLSASRLNLKVETADSRATGSRTSSSGRHGRWACWHVFRDVIAAIMTADPAARVQTGLTVYRRASGFMLNYPQTRHTNVGSLYAPADLASLCPCSGGHAGTYGGPWVEALQDKIIAAA